MNPVIKKFFIGSNKVSDNLCFYNIHNLVFGVHNLDFITSIFVIGITVVLIRIFKSESFACAKEKRERTYFPIFSICAKEKRGVRYFPIFSRIVTLITGIGFYRRICTFYIQGSKNVSEFVKYLVL